MEFRSNQDSTPISKAACGHTLVSLLFSLLDGGEETLFGFRAFRSGFDATLHAEEVLVVTQRLAAFAAEPLAQFQEDLLLDLRPLLEKFASRVRSYRALKR